MYRIVLWATIWLATCGIVHAQTLQIEGGSVFENENICLDVSVTGFQNVVSMDFQLRWDSTVLDFSSVTSLTSLPGFDNSIISDPTETSATTPKNLLLVSWFDNQVQARNLPDGEVLFEVCFEAVGSLGSSSTMNLLDLEFFDGGFNPIDFEARDGIVNVSNTAGSSLSFDFPTISGDSGTVVCMPLTVVNFDTISSFSFGVKWDATVLSYNTSRTPGNLQGFTNGGISLVGADSITVSWNDVDNSGESLSSGAELLELCFRIVGAPARSSFVNVGNLNATKPTSGPVTQISSKNGLVIVNSPPIASDFRLTANDEVVNPGASICVPVRVSGFEDLDAFNFDIAWDNTVLQYTSTTGFAALNGLNSSSVSTNGSPASGISVDWSDPDGMGRELFFNTQLFEVCFTAIGSAGSTSPFDISNASASNADGLPVEEITNDAEISIINPSAPDLILALDSIELSNGGQGCLTLSVQNFNDIQQLDFDINWNSQNLIFQSASVTANVPGLDDGNLTTPANGANAGELLFRWEDANGIGRLLNDGTELMELCFQADGANTSRAFAVNNINVQNTNPSLETNGTSRPGRITILPDSGGGNLTLSAGDLNLSSGGSGCFPVRVSNFVDIVTLQLTLDWDSNIFTFDRVQNLAALPGFSQSNISAPSPGSLIMSWDDSDLSGETLMNNAVLFEICGDAVNEGTAEVEFTQTEGTTDNGQTVLTINTDNSQINVSPGGGSNLEIYAPNLNINVGDQVCVPISARNFLDLIVAEMRLSWDNNILQFEELRNFAGIEGLEMSSFSTPPANGTDNLIFMAWLHETLLGQTLPDDAVLFEVCFTALQPGISPINLFNAEFADNNQMLIPGTLTDGSVTVSGTAPGLRIQAPELTTTPGASVCVPFTVKDFDSLIVMEFSITWDDTVLEFSELRNSGNLLYLNASSFSTPPTNMTTDRIIVSWLDNDLTGQTLADDTELFTVCYDVIGSLGEQSVINMENGEFAVTDRVVNGALDDGLVRIEDGATLDFELASTTGNRVDAGETACIPVQVTGFQDLTALIFDFSWDETAFAFSSVRNLAALADFELTDITTPQGSGTPGMLSVNWSDSDGSGETLPDNSILFEVCLEAVGQAGDQTELMFTDLTVSKSTAGAINSNTVNGNIAINQSSNEGLQFYMTDQEVEVGDEFCIPVRVNDFDSILSIQFFLDYDSSLLRFDRVTNIANLPSLGAGSFANPNMGRLIFSWIDDIDLSGESLSDGDTLFSVCFTALSPGVTTVDFSSEEVSNAQSTLLTPILTGSTITVNGNEPTGELLFKMEDLSGTAGQTLCVQLTAENFSNISSTNFTVSWDENVVTYQSVNINGTLANFDENSILDPIESPMLGASLIVDWDNTAGGVSLSSPADLFELCFELTGAPGTQTVLAIENLIVEDASGVLITGARDNGSISINPNQTNTVRVIAGMERGDRNEEVCVDITVENFSEMLSAEFILEWDPNVLKFSQLANLADLPDLNNASFSVPTQPNIPPGLLVFSWFDNNLNLHSLQDGEVLFSICFDLVGAAGSNSILLLGELEFSQGTGAAIPSSKVDGRVDINNVVSAPTVGFTIADGTVNPGGSVCLPVEVNNFQSISSLDLDFEWDDNVLRFDSVQILASIADFDATNFSNLPGLLNLQWNDMSGQGITQNDGEVLFNLCFTAIGQASSSSQVFISSGNIENASGLALNFAADNGVVTLNDILALSGILIDSINCAGDQDGSIELSVSGGDGNYSFTWDPSSVGSGPRISGLSAGQYSVTISDGSSSMITRMFTLSEPDPLVINPNIMGVNPPNSNGAIDLNVSGGTPPYNISWCCDLPDNQEEQTGLSIGVYSGTITDANGCVLETGDINLDGALFAQLVNVDSTSCHDASDGSIEINVSGGTPSYTITWSDGTNVIGVGERISGLLRGDYFYTITDSSTPPRTLEGSASVDGPAELIVTVDVSPETNARNDGSITTNIAGGTPNYTYRWLDHQTGNVSTSENLFGLSSGYYSLTVQDVNACTTSIDSIFVGPALSVPSSGIIVDSISCAGACDARITLLPQGGSGEYVYSYDGSGNVPENTRENLCAGERIIIVEDINTGDRTVVRVTLEEPAPIIIEAITVGVSAGNDGEILLEVDGGTEPYEFIWNTRDTTQNLIGVSEGSYDVTVTDNNGCENVLENIQVTAQTISLDLISVTNVDCASDENGSIQFNISGGCQPYSYTWRQNGTVVSNQKDLMNVPAGFYELQVIDSCDQSIFSGFIQIQALSDMVLRSRVLSNYNGFDVSGHNKMDGSARVDVTGGIEEYSYEWSNGSVEEFATGLSSGEVFVTVTDALGCIEVDTLELTVPDPIQVSFVIIQSNNCFEDSDGIARAELEGGVEPYSYIWQNTGSTTSTSQGLQSGFNSLTIEDANGITVVDSVFISSNPSIQVDTIIRPDFGNSEGSITLVVSGGMAPYTFQWNDEDNSTTSSLSGLLAGEYGVVITDEEGCSIFMNLRVPLKGDAPQCLEAREVFTPNADGKNDFFVINCIENFENDIQIYNRWGKVVFEQTNYDNFWNGRNQDGELLPQGAYFYVLSVINDQGQREVVKGHISLIR